MSNYEARGVEDFHYEIGFQEEGGLEETLTSQVGSAVGPRRSKPREAGLLQPRSRGAIIDSWLVGFHRSKRSDASSLSKLSRRTLLGGVPRRVLVRVRSSRVDVGEAGALSPELTIKAKECLRCGIRSWATTLCTLGLGVFWT